MLKLSGSGLERASLCIGSAVLPHHEEVAPAATRGNVWHEFLSNVNTGGLAEALAKAPEEHRHNLSAMDFDRLPLDPARYASEVAFAFNWRTGAARELGRGLTRQEARALCTENEIPGIADVVSLEDGCVVVLDFKTGWTDYGPISKNWQLGFYALCAARAYGRDAARVGLVRIREDGDAYFVMGELDFFDLEDIALRIHALAEEGLRAQRLLATGQHLPYRMGEHCKLCNAMATCPAMTTLAREVAQEATRSEVQLALTEETVLPVYERLRAMKLVIDRVEKALDIWADARPIPLPGGKVYGRKKHGRDVWDATAARALFEELYGVDFAAQAVDIQPRVTKDGLRRALRGLNIKGLKVEPVVKDICARLRASGGLTTKYTYPVMVHKAALTEEAGDAGRQDSARAIPGDTAGGADSDGGDGPPEEACEAQG